VIARGRHRHGKALKDGFVVVDDRAGLAVHEVGCADYAASEGLADGLMSKADTENRYLAGEVADQFDADAGFVRCARAGGDDDSFGVHGFDLGNGDLIVAAHFDVSAQFSEILDQVIGKRIVVIEYEDQINFLPVSAYNGILPDLSTHCHQPCGPARVSRNPNHLKGPLGTRWWY
jgi:hypothetical protein